MNSFFRRILATMTLSLAVFGGLQFTSPAPAEAASYVTACFKHTNGVPFNRTINLQYKYNGQWYTTSSQEGNYSGCVAWNISGWLRDYPLQMSVSYQVGRAYFYGRSPYFAPAGGSRYNLGTGWVYQS